VVIHQDEVCEECRDDVRDGVFTVTIGVRASTHAVELPDPATACRRCGMRPRVHTKLARPGRDKVR
jgi:hypothetical protein